MTTTNNIYSILDDLKEPTKEERRKKYYVDNRQSILARDRLRMLLKRAIINNLSQGEIAEKIAKQKEREKNGTKKNQQKIDKENKKKARMEKEKNKILLRKDKMIEKLKRIENDLHQYEEDNVLQ